jgi:hypothetical protein
MVDGIVDEYKAKLVTSCYLQVHELDFYKTLSLNVKLHNKSVISLNIKQKL